MSIAIVTDTAAYLTAAQINQYQITVLPITVILGDTQYPESELTDAAFFDYVNAKKSLPTTSQISLGQTQAAYDQLVANGVTEIIAIHLSSGMTSYMDNLTVFCRTYSKATVYPIDALSASASEANLCLLAGRLVAAGLTAPAIVDRLKQLRATQHVYFAVDSLKHLARTGRLSNRSALVGSLLSIKPILTVNEQGRIVALDKARTMRRALANIEQRLADQLATTTMSMHATIINANNLALAKKWQAKLQVTFPQVRFTIGRLGPAISVHTGEKTIGLIWEADWQQF